VDGFTLEYTRGRGVSVSGGARVTLRNLALRNIGGAGIVIEGGTRHAVERSEVAYTGDSAIEITGGERRTLTPGGHAVRDCDLHHMGEWVRTYNPAVKVNGVGNRVEHNAIHHGPHAGILLTGNDHVIEGNDMHHLALETGDVGAVYIGRDYTERGVTIRHNYIHELGGVGLGSMAVYLDDCASGVTVRGNVFYKLKYGAFVGGGRDNRVENNLFVQCSPAIHVDARGLDPRPVWQNMVYRTMKPKLAEMRVTEPPYRQRYPEILSVLPYLEKPGGVPPEGNLIRRNLISGPAFDVRKPAEPYVGDMSGNLTLEGGFSFDPEARVYRLPDREDIRALGFEPIPLDRVGPRK
jgi:parallel beta helix pectate lyase-like protein